MNKMRVDKSYWLVVYDGRKALRGEVGKDLVKLPVYETEKQVLLPGGCRLGRPPQEDAAAPLRSRGAAGGPGRHSRPRSGSSGSWTGHRRRRTCRG